MKRDGVGGCKRERIHIRNKSRQIRFILPQQVLCAVFRDAEDPDSESGRIPQLAEMLPRGEKRVLRDVLRREGITDNLFRFLQNRVFIPFHQFVKRAALADQRQIDQRPVAHVSVFYHTCLPILTI